MAAEVAHRGLRALAHRIPQEAGERQRALAGHAGGLDEQDLAAGRRPGQAGRDAREPGAVGQLAVVPRRAQQRGDLGRADRDRLLPSIGPAAGGPFNLVFLDPPYRKNLIPQALASLKDGGWLLPNALIVAETDAKEDIDAPGFTPIDERDYGETRVRFLTAAE